MPQTHLPGTEAEVDFGDVHIVLAGVVTRCYLFSLRLSYSAVGHCRGRYVLRPDRERVPITA